MRWLCLAVAWAVIGVISVNWLLLKYGPFRVEWSLKVKRVDEACGAEDD